VPGQNHNLNKVGRVHGIGAWKANATAPPVGHLLRGDRIGGRDVKILKNKESILGESEIKRCIK